LASPTTEESQQSNIVFDSLNVLLTGSPGNQPRMWRGHRQPYAATMAKRDAILVQFDLADRKGHDVTQSTIRDHVRLIEPAARHPVESSRAESPSPTG
jgi:hypothetical protein